MITKKDHLDRIIREEVYTLANATVQHFIDAGIDELEDIENRYTVACPHCGEDVTHGDHGAPEGENWCYECPHCSGGYDDPVEDQQEVMQWFIVSDWLAEKLTEAGEVTWSPHDVSYWGRTGCGYALTEEGCLKALAERLAS